MEGGGEEEGAPRPLSGRRPKGCVPVVAVARVGSAASVVGALFLNRVRLA